MTSCVSFSKQYGCAHEFTQADIAFVEQCGELKLEVSYELQQIGSLTGVLLTKLAVFLMISPKRRGKTTCKMVTEFSESGGARLLGHAPLLGVLQYV